MSAVIRNALAKYFLYYFGAAGTQGLYGLISTDPADTPSLLILSYVAAVAGIALIIRFDYRMSKQYPEEGRLFWLADLFYIAALPCTLMFSLPTVTLPGFSLAYLMRSSRVLNGLSSRTVMISSKSTDATIGTRLSVL